jgi:hypothetical protein
VCTCVADLDLGEEIAQLLGQAQSPRKMGHAILHPTGDGLKVHEVGGELRATPVSAKTESIVVLVLKLMIFCVMLQSHEIIEGAVPY